MLASTTAVATVQPAKLQRAPSYVRATACGERCVAGRRSTRNPVPASNSTARTKTVMSAAPAAAPAAAAASADLEAVDAALQRLSSNKAAWAAAPLDERITVLKEIRGRMLDQLLPWARAAAGIRCTSRDTAVAGDLLATMVVIAGQLDGFILSLDHLKRHGTLPRPPSTTRAVTAAADGGSSSGTQPKQQQQQQQTVVDVFPWGIRDRRLTLLGSVGGRVQLYLKPGEQDTQGHFYRNTHSGKVAVVLGAGNQHFLALADVLHMLFVEGCVAMLKYHPIQEPVAQYIDYVLEPLALRGYYASSTNPDLGVTQHMLYSPLTDCVHMTGGTATHDAIVWGSDPAEQARRRAANDPLLKVPITSELGCVTPWLVVPGPWSQTDITHHSRQLAEALANNCSCNCLAPKVILLADGWDQADQFVAAVKAELAQLPAPAPYYPGLRQRYDAFKQQYPQAEAIASEPADPGASCGVPLPYLVNELPAYPSVPASEYAFQVEPFAPVITFVRVPTGSTELGNGSNSDGSSGSGSSLEERFLEAAVRAANRDLWGTLSCTILVHPDTQQRYSDAVQRALDGLQYGSVVVNAWSVTGFIPAQGHWGGFQGGQTLADVGSGLGAVHNSYMFDHTQKAVVHTPFISSLHTMPEKYAPMPLGVAKVVAGLVHGGPWGVLKLLLFSSK